MSVTNFLTNLEINLQLIFFSWKYHETLFIVINFELKSY